MFSFCRIGLICLALLLASGRGEARELEDALPGNALMTIVIPDATKLRAEWPETALGKFEADAAVAQFLASGRQRLNGVFKAVGQPQLTLDGVLAQAGGGLAMVGMPGGDPCRWVVVIERPGAELQQIVKTGMKGIAAAPRTRFEQLTSTSVGGTKYTRIRIISEEPAKIPTKTKGKKKKKGEADLDFGGIPGATPAMQQHVDEYAIYSSPEVLLVAEGKGHPIEAVLDQMKTASGGLSAVPGYARLKKAGGAGNLEVFANLRGLAPGWEKGLQKSFGNSLLAPDAAGFRLGEMQAALLTLHNGRAGAELRAQLLAPAPRQGVVQIPFLAGPPPTAAQAAPAGAEFFGAHRMPLPGLYDVVHGLTEKIAPAIAAAWELFTQQLTQGTQMELRRDLVAHLGDEWGVVSMKQPQAGAPLEHVAGLLALREPEAARKGLDVVLRYFAASLKMYAVDAIAPKDVPGAQQAWVLREPTGNPNKVGAPIVWLAAAGKWLVVSADADALKQSAVAAGGAGGKTLAETAAYKQAMAGLSPKRAGEIFGTPRMLFALIANALPAGDKKNPGWVDARRLPAPEVFAKHFGAAAGERIMEPDVVQLHLMLPAAK